MDIKSKFPIFKKYPDLVYLDNGATTLKPEVVLEKMNEYYQEYSANIHRGIYGISERATEEYENVRVKVARFIGAAPSEIIFTSGTTASINLVASGWADKNLKKGDEILVTEMEHHSNLVPWQNLAKKKGLKIKFLPLNGIILDISGEVLKNLVNEKTKMMAMVHVSNVLGTVNPVLEIIEKVKKINPKLVVVVDGAQAVAHMPIKVKDLGADFYVFSGHKMYGPTGIGVLWGKKERLEEMDPVNFGGGMIEEVTEEGFRMASIPFRFEGGTPPIGEAIGLGKAVDFIEELGWKDIIEQEINTYKYLEEMIGELAEMMGEGTIKILVMKGAHPHDVAQILDTVGVCVRAGHHCAMPLHQKLGLMASTRVSLAIYNDKSDIDKLVEGIKKVSKIFVKEE
jgi:cysteine desulfurase/selenocysteine lyase